MTPETYKLKPIKSGKEDVNDVYDSNKIKIKKVRLGLWQKFCNPRTLLPISSP